MTDREKLRRDINGLNESIRFNWTELESKNLHPDERSEIRRDIARLIEELAALVSRLDDLDRNATA